MTWQSPTNKLIKAMFVAQLSATAQEIKHYWRVGEFFTITIRDNKGHIVFDHWYRHPDEVPKSIYVGPLKPRWDWKATVTFWSYLDSVLRRGRAAILQLFVKNSRGIMHHVQNKRALKLARRRLHAKSFRVHPKRSRRSSRLRVSPEVVTKTYPHYYENQQEGVRWNTLLVEVTHRRSWTGVRTPGWASLPKNKRPINAHSVYIEDFSDNGFVEKLTKVPELPPTTYNSFSLDPFRAALGAFGWPSPGAADHNAAARNKAIAKLKQDPPDPEDFESKDPRVVARAKSQLKASMGVGVNNLAQDFYQFEQITRQVVSTCSRVTRSIAALKRGNWPLAAKFLWRANPPVYRKNGGPSYGNTVAENWLEMQYGWKPLLQDVKGVFEGLAKLNLGDCAVKSVVSVARAESVSGGNLLYHPPQNEKIGKWAKVHFTKCRLQLRYRVDDHLKAFLAQTGFTNPVNLAWEVVPYSFVVDWFLPVGQFLESLSSWDGLTFLDGVQSQFTQESSLYGVDWEGVAPFWGPGVTARVLGTYTVTKKRYDRIKLTAFPVSFWPELKNPFTLTHSLNAIALLRSAFKKV